ncbi:MAG: 16S rRNA (guanine(966)-N(2))-methyltransferase RsmD [Syntrophobacteraceae bacterium]|nr:16S rRNA (guanine(966)-N(2))-methyltransferase RsmD [Syntrophobacteraceae bacterium]
MRIVAGSFRGRRLHSPRGKGVRPTVDRVREAVFSIIAPHVPGARVLDLFAGTGALGLEALSRGASTAVFVDRSIESVRLIHENAALCRAEDRVRVIHGSLPAAVRFLDPRKGRFDLIFMDPPYGEGWVEKTLLLLDEIAHPQALVIAEHHAKDVLPSRCGIWTKTEERRYGDTSVSFFVKDLSR